MDLKGNEPRVFHKSRLNSMLNFGRLKFESARNFYLFFCTLGMLLVSVALVLIAKLHAASRTAEQSLFLLPKSIPSFKSSTMAIEVDLREVSLVDNTLSMSIKSTQGLLITIVIHVLTFVSFIALINLTSRIRFSDSGSLVLTFIPTLLTFLCIDDLPDEGYVWATKIENFQLHGILGIQNWDGHYSESTVGFFQFLISGILYVLFDITVEQSIYIPILISVSLCSLILYCLFRLSNFRKSLSYVTSLLIMISPPLILTSAMGFDNLILLAIILYWLFVEVAPFSFRLRQWSLLLIAILSPTIRLELLLFSVTLFGVIVTREYRSGNVRLKGLFITTYTLICGVFASLFLGYKLISFDELIPAMASYKSPRWDFGTIGSGANYVRNSFGETSWVILNLALLFLVIRLYVNRQNPISYRNFGTTKSYLVLVSIYLSCIGFILAILAGGDYFPFYLARYIFPYSVLLLVVMLIIAGEKRLLRGLYIRPSVFVVCLIALFLSLHKASAWAVVLRDVGRVNIERSSCDYLASLSISKALESRGFPSPRVVGTPEVAGITYFLGAKLLDMIGLVDTRTKIFYAPLYPGDPLHKFRPELDKATLSNASIIWLQAAQCNVTGSYFDQELTSQHESIENFFGSKLASYRFPQAEFALTYGYRPIVIGFTYRNLDDQIQFGIAKLLALPPKKG